MKKFLDQGLPLLTAALLLIPPIKFRIPNPPTEYWPYFMAFIFFLGIRILFTKTNLTVKFIAIFSYISCSFSSVPHISFSSYFSIIMFCYFYIGLTKIKNWGPMFIILKTVLIMNCILIAVQFLGEDKFLNFGLDKNITSFGLIGHHMQMGSFSVILGVVLSLINPLFYLFPFIVGLFCGSVWAVFCASVGLWFNLRSKKLRIIALVALIFSIGFCVKTGKIQENIDLRTGRLGVWKRSVELMQEKNKFAEGFGPGTFKVTFNGLSNMKDIIWTNAHNCWLQLFFELGVPFSIFIVIAWSILLRSLIKKKRIKLYAGFIVISLNMLVHFPTRILQCVPLILIFLAWCEKDVNPYFQRFR